jgi:hypothetical protein
MGKRTFALLIMFGLLTGGTAWAEEEKPSVTVEIKVGTGINNLEPTGVADKFTLDDKQLVGWSRIVGAQEPTTIHHVWLYEREEKANIELAVKSSSYRTYSRKSLWNWAGEWVLEVRDANGKTLGSKKIMVARTGDEAATGEE